MQAVKDAGGADVALEMVGGDQVAKDLSVMKPGGRVVMIAFPAGAKAEVDFNVILRRRLTLTGSTLRARDADEGAAGRPGGDACVAVGGLRRSQAGN